MAALARISEEIIHAALKIANTANGLLHAPTRSLRDADILFVGKSASFEDYLSDEFRATPDIDRRNADFGEQAGNEKLRMDVALAYGEMTFECICCDTSFIPRKGDQRGRGRQMGATSRQTGR